MAFPVNKKTNQIQVTKAVFEDADKEKQEVFYVERVQDRYSLSFPGSTTLKLNRQEAKKLVEELTRLLS